MAADPLFANSAGGDYSLATNSPCIGAGVSLGHIINDLDGQLRPLDGNRSGTAEWDIGAYEYLNILADTDHDGMPDGWEDQYYGDPTNGLPNEDEDNDGSIDLDESLADTNPTNEASLFRLVSISKTSPLLVFFPSSSNRLYSMQSSSNLQTWLAVPGQTNRTGNGGLFSMADTNDAITSMYRVWVGLP